MKLKITLEDINSVTLSLISRNIIELELSEFEFFNGGGGSTIPNTDYLKEGLFNKYFTQERARLALVEDLKLKADKLDLDNVVINVNKNANDLINLNETVINNSELIDLKASQLDLNTTNEAVEANRLEILTKADLTALAMLTALVNTKADQVYVQEQIAILLDNDQHLIASVQEISDALKENEDLLEALEYTVANRVRFDVATQALTALQKSNARTNIGAEEIGIAQMLIAQITPQSIGSATSAQGVKADTALQPSSVATVALDGLFNSLLGKNKIFDVVHSAYVDGANVVINNTDTLGVMLGKLQTQIKNAGGSTKPINWIDLKTIANFHTSVYLANTTLKIANINGELWMKGIFQVTAQITAGTNPIFTIPNKDWYVTTTIPQSKVGLVATFPLYNGSFSPYYFGFIQAPAINSMQFFCNQNTPSSDQFSFVAYNVGTLLNPNIGL